ncbi:IclR family transcriptional regulator [Aminobacter aganoensis]|nr:MULTISPECIES: IclR family transcriptional regulator [Aminobacter]KQU74498.1 hypothetical protein ASC75_20995 [Aminobacter sp. DSM 101952]
MSGSLSLERGLAVLRLLKENGAQGVREMSRRLDLSPAAVQRLLNTLSEHDYAEQDTERRYRLGAAVLGLAYGAQDQNRLIRSSQIELENLARAHGFNCFAGVRRGAAAILLLCVQGTGPIVIRANPGDPCLLHTTAIGKALLVGMSIAEMRELIGEGPYEQRTPRSITGLEKLASQIRLAQSVGYTTSLNESIMGVLSYGSPILDDSGQPVAAISVAMPRDAISRARFSEIGDLVKDAADRIAAKLGHTLAR